MSNVEVFAYAKNSTLASNLGRYILRAQNEALLKGDAFKVAVSGGSLLKTLKTALVEDEEVRSKIHWSKWHVYFADERIVPLTHDDSNYKGFAEAILNPLTEEYRIAAPEVFTINPSLYHETDTANDEKIAAEYESLLPKDHTFDLVLLGLGPDGHTASLFPGHPQLKETQKLITNVVDSPKPPPRRITFTLPLLLKAKNIAFVAEGASKAPVITKIFETEKSFLPGEYVNELGGIPIKWFVSNDAIAGAPIINSKFE